MRYKRHLHNERFELVDRYWLTVVIELRVPAAELYTQTAVAISGIKLTRIYDKIVQAVEYE
jgi:hypothetical protein